MTGLSETIHSSAARHRALVRTLAELDYAPSAREQSDAYVRDLQEQKTAADAVLARLARRTEKERAEHLEFSKSVSRKWANRLVGKGAKFDERASKEEREYLESLEQELSQRSQQEKLSSDLLEATRINEELKLACRRREHAQTELDSLYERVFSGPTPDFPQDDEFEMRVRAAERANTEAQRTLNVESQTLSILADAGNTVQQCLQKMGTALTHNSDDGWALDWAADRMESSAITAAQSAASRADMLISQARRLNAAVQPLPNIQIPQHSMSNIYFDNAYSNMAQHNRIKQGQAAVQHAAAQLHEEIRAAEERVTIAATQASVTTEDLANARRELHDLREAMFSSIAESDGPNPDDAGAPPPPFTPGDTPSLFLSPVHTPPAGPPPAWPTPSLNQSSPFSPPTGAPPGWPTPVASPGFPSAPPAANQPSPFSPGPVNQTSPFSPVATHPASPFSPPHGPPPGWQGPTPSLATSPPASGSNTPRPAGPAGWSSSNPYAALLASKASTGASKP